ncbi:MAG: ABC transporter substrate-binding protein [Phycisphaerales bacterium]|nr:ABC transporter substrate-binding protein [Phycisphaerales bacterium]
MPEPRPILTIGHSPDPDDAFMWWPLGNAEPGAEREPTIDAGRFRFRAVPADIESLNLRASERGDLDVTAMSAHAYPHARGRYRITSCGASMGDGFGPKVVAREARGVDWLRSAERLIAVPGERTSAYLALRMLAGRAFGHVVVDFDRIIEVVAAGERVGGVGAPDAGLVIHEGQLTYARDGLTQVVDLGAWWKERTGGPLPLGLNCVRRDLDERFGPGALEELNTTLRRSVEHAMERRETGLGVAMGYARGLTLEDADTFVGMYVNRLTVDMGREGVGAIARLLREGAGLGLCPEPGEIDVLGVGRG